MKQSAKVLNKLRKNYNMIMLGDFNVELEEAKMAELLNIEILKNRIK